jgi:hypothetical protein
MDLISIFRALWRHKIVTIPVLALTFLGAIYIVAVKPPIYQASASFALVYPPGPPTAAQIAADPTLGKISTANPLLEYGDPLAITQIVINLLGTASSQQALAKAGAGSGYQVAPNASSSEIVDITGVGSTPQAAIHSAVLVTAAAEQALHQVQVNQGVNPMYMIKTYQLQSPGQAAQKLSGVLRDLVAVLGLGLLLLFIAISIAQSMGSIRIGRSSNHKASGSRVLNQTEPFDSAMGRVQASREEAGSVRNGRERYYR